MSKPPRLNDAQRAIVERKQGQAARALSFFADFCTGGTAAADAITEDVRERELTTSEHEHARRTIDAEGHAVIGDGKEPRPGSLHDRLACRLCGECHFDECAAPNPRAMVPARSVDDEIAAEERRHAAAVARLRLRGRR